MLKKMIRFALGAFCTFSLLFAISQNVFADTKEKTIIGDGTVTLKIDLGDNVTSLTKDGGSAFAENLTDAATSAEQKVKEVYPVYHAQAEIEGRAGKTMWITFVVIMAIIAVSCAFAGKYWTEGFYGGTIVSGILLCIGLIVIVFNMPVWIGMIENPDYWAIHKVMDDIVSIIKPIFAKGG
jgi:uncharacterized membrane protein